MSKAILISIHPKWCEKIASGQKTIEVRKTRPKIDTPLKCYIYQTKKKWYCSALRLLGKEDLAEYLEENHGQVIGEFVCDSITEYIPEFWPGDDVYNAVWVYDTDETGVDRGFMHAIMSNEDDTPRAFEKSICMSVDALKKYLGTGELLKPFYGWHISDLIIYDKPKELREFKGRKLVWRGNNHIHDYEIMTRPPQSWCYVEELT